jgi:hypothetical protein
MFVKLGFRLNAVCAWDDRAALSDGIGQLERIELER